MTEAPVELLWTAGAMTAVAIAAAVGYLFGRNGKMPADLPTPALAQPQLLVIDRAAGLEEQLRRVQAQADLAARITHTALHEAREKLRAREGLVESCELALDLPPSLDGEGYLYVIEFSTGVIKVGQTADPRRRLPEHRRDADAFKVAIVNFWISPAHWNYLDNEIDLINRCMQVSSRARREYFRDLSFVTAVGFANELTFYTQEGVSDEHVEH
ncbi:GIY-YIG nuclease family protein [Dactylosporangium sp. NPDC000244]|uniref:GIY-YIG nuclease family protein n=1 Tax=Dactylosporangium sp. NPDC000244 TaxID=3154365 RepID=UPI00331F4945